MAVCIPHTSYLSTPEFYANSLHSIAVIELPVIFFGAYCILLKTPKEMSSIKWLMAVLHILTAFTDFIISVLALPYILFPLTAGYGLGVIDAPGLLFYLMVTSVGAIGASIVSIYENRYFVLFGWDTWWKRARKPALTFVYTVTPFFFIPPYFNPPDQELGKRIVLQTLPCLPPFTYNNRPMYVMELNYTIPAACIALMATFYAIISFCFFTLVCWKIFGRKSTAVSQNTRRMQGRFAIAFTLQSAFLITALLMPIAVMLATMYFYHHNQVINNFTFIAFSFHGVGSTIVMILVHKPYREFAFSFFGFTREKPVGTRVASIVL